jgi:hypothetical protein
MYNDIGCRDVEKAFVNLRIGEACQWHVPREFGSVNIGGTLKCRRCYLVDVSFVQGAE